MRFAISNIGWEAKQDEIVYSLMKKYGFKVPSMQSIWYGRQEMIFGTQEERQILLEYTKLFWLPKNMMALFLLKWENKMM